MLSLYWRASTVRAVVGKLLTRVETVEDAPAAILTYGGSAYEFTAYQTPQGVRVPAPLVVPEFEGRYTVEDSQGRVLAYCGMVHTGLDALASLGGVA